MRLAESRRRDALRRFSGWQRCGRPPLAWAIGAGCRPVDSRAALRLLLRV